MHEAIVVRTSKDENGNVEYRTKEGGWSLKRGEALHTSEEDAKAIVRTLQAAHRRPSYVYDLKLVE